MLLRTRDPFRGRLFVQDGGEHGDCVSSYAASGSPTASTGDTTVEFHAKFGSCNMRRQRSVSGERRAARTRQFAAQSARRHVQLYARRLVSRSFSDRRRSRLSRALLLCRGGQGGGRGARRQVAALAGCRTTRAVARLALSSPRQSTKNTRCLAAAINCARHLTAERFGSQASGSRSHTTGNAIWVRAAGAKCASGERVSCSLERRLRRPHCTENENAKFASSGRGSRSQNMRFRIQFELSLLRATLKKQSESAFLNLLSEFANQNGTNNCGGRISRNLFSLKQTADNSKLFQHSCYVDDGRGKRFELIDGRGCAVDRTLLGDLTYDERDASAFVDSRVSRKKYICTKMSKNNGKQSHQGEF